MRSMRCRRSSPLLFYHEACRARQLESIAARNSRVRRRRPRRCRGRRFGRLSVLPGNLLSALWLHRVHRILCISRRSTRPGKARLSPPSSLRSTSNVATSNVGRRARIGLVGAEWSKLLCWKEERTLRDRLGSRRALHDGKNLCSRCVGTIAPMPSSFTACNAMRSSHCDAMRV
jgi:hypothetical protein